MEAISNYVSYKEAVRSNTATRHKIDNAPNSKQLETMRYVSVKVFDKVREYFGLPIFISSFFRNAEVNKLVGSSSSSFHLLGAAIDIDADVFGGVKNSEVFEYIKNHLPFTELIWEFGDEKEPNWVHVALVKGRDNEKKIKYFKK